VKRLIWDTHVRHCSAGVQLLLRLVREYCRILERRGTFKSAISKCVRCRCFEGRKPDPAVAPLLTEASVFKICSLTLCGRCFCVERKSLTFEFFTCAVWCAVHLELITSLTTEAFLQAFGRFVARRGRASVIYWYNRTYLRGTEVCLKWMDMDLVFRYSSASNKYLEVQSTWIILVGWMVGAVDSGYQAAHKMTLERASLMY